MELWRKLGIQVEIIRPWVTDDGNAIKLRTELEGKGYIMHANRDWAKINGAPCISYCSGEALEQLPEIRKHTKTFIFVNCMTFLFKREIEYVRTGLITHELYQRKEVMANLLPKLKLENKDIIGDVVKPYFDMTEFPFHDRIGVDHQRLFQFGRISRNDAAKFHPKTIWMYEAMVAPQMKEGMMLGVNENVIKKIGKIPEWIRHATAGTVSQQDFYKFAGFLIQPCDPQHTENLPRISFEAMASGTLMIVDDRGGFQDQVIHGETGWLCKNEKEFVYYSSRAAYEFDETQKMRKRAKEFLMDNWGESAVSDNWRSYFKKVGVL